MPGASIPFPDGWTAQVVRHPSGEAISAPVSCAQGYLDGVVTTESATQADVVVRMPSGEQAAWCTVPTPVSAGDRVALPHITVS